MPFALHTKAIDPTCHDVDTIVMDPLLNVMYGTSITNGNSQEARKQGTITTTDTFCITRSMRAVLGMGGVVGEGMTQSEIANIFDKVCWNE